MRENNCVYLDKTRFIYKILKSTDIYYFLSRPRRFGKSLTIDTLDNIFSGNRELFKGLYIDSTDYDWQEYPVIRLDFNNISTDTNENLRECLKSELNLIAQKYAIEITHENAIEIFKQLIRCLNDKYQKGVVVLIDEYDKPIISHLGLGEDRLKIGRENQEFLKSLYDPLKKQELENYWFTTGTPTFLVNLIKEKQYNLTGLENLSIYKEDIKSFDLEYLEIEPLLFQTGYLTIKDVLDNNRQYVLTYPNYEVEIGFTHDLLKVMSDNKVGYLLVNSLQEKLRNENYDEYFALIKSIFAGISYTIIPKKNDKEIDILTGLTKYELYYHSLFYLLTSLMTDIYTKVETEVLTNVGRLDMAVVMSHKVFIFEFKLDQSAEQALEQIKDKKYADRFIGQDKKIVMIGINFSSEKKNVVEWKVES